MGTNNYLKVVGRVDREYVFFDDRDEESVKLALAKARPSADAKVIAFRRALDLSGRIDGVVGEDPYEKLTVINLQERIDAAKALNGGSAPKVN